MTGQQSKPLSSWLGFTYRLWNRMRDDSSDACHSFLAPSRLLWTLRLKTAPENSSDGPMIYLTHADVFCIKQPKCFSALYWWKMLLQQRFGCVIPSEHFLHHQVCFADNNGVADSKQERNILVNVGQGNYFPPSWQLWHTESKIIKKEHSVNYTWIIVSTKQQQQSSAHFNS